VDIDVGPFKVIGGLPEVHAKYGLDTTDVFPLTGPNPITDKPYLVEGPFEIPAFRPEEVTAFDFGYRGLYMKGKMYVDAYLFQNTYNGFIFSANIAYNNLRQVDLKPGLLAEFNTPYYRLNLGIGKHNFVKNTSFNINWMWQNEFLWESKFGVAQIPAYATLDAQVRYKVKKWKSSLTLGGSNIMNQYYTTGYGNASVGGLYYITWAFDELMN